MSWNTFKTQVYNLVNNNKTTLGIQEVYAYPRVNFDGYPSVSLFPSDNTNDYSTTSENERIYAWRIRLFNEVKDQGLEAALDALYPVADDLIDKFDQENELDSGQTIGVSLPARYTFINIFAIPGAFGEIEDENLAYTEMILKIKVSVDVT